MNQNDKFNLLRNKEILNILLGGSNYGQLNDGICMPYLSGQAVCDIAKQFGCNLNIFDGKLNKSRWKLLDELFDYCTINNSISRLLAFLFSKEQFSNILSECKTPEEFENNYSNLFKSVLEKINAILYLGNNELVVMNNHFLYKTNWCVNLN